MNGIDLESVSGHSSSIVGLSDGDSDRVTVGSKLGLSEAKSVGEIDGVDVGRDEDVGAEEGLSETICVGLDEG